MGDFEMPDISQIRVGEVDYTIKAKKVSNDANIKTVNSVTLIGSGNIETMTAYVDESTETACWTLGTEPQQAESLQG